MPLLNFQIDANKFVNHVIVVLVENSRKNLVF